MKTKSEGVFEEFLLANSLQFEKINVDRTPRPDYRVSVGGSEIIFEVKELTKDVNFGVVKDSSYPHLKFSSRTAGNHIRRRIRDSRKQIQFGADQGIPSILLVYNDIDPVLQIFGTEAADFTTAMFGAFTIRIDTETGRASDRFYGEGGMLGESRNTSFSAVGHLCDRGGKTTVTLYENVFAKVRVPYAQLPACFDVQRIEVSTLG